MNFIDSREAQDSLGEASLFGTVGVYSLQPLPDGISLTSVVDVIESRVPKHFFENIDAVYIGKFKEFEENDTNAFYSDGALFITNEQTNQEDIIDDIIHEVAHAVERNYGNFIYDSSLTREFLSRREKLYYRLVTANENYGLELDLNKEDFSRLEYNHEFDQLLYQSVGYDLLHQISCDLFVSPYGATSLQEYWANGFENYYVESPRDVEKVSPVLYNKISSLAEGG